MTNTRAVRRPRLGIVTCSRLPEPQPDDALLLDALDGAEVVAVPWDGPGAVWQSCDALLVRSPWDYHERVEEFIGWIEAVATVGTPLWNPAALLVWNARKTYLRELASGGVRTVPTLWLEGDDPTGWRQAIDATGWHDLVVKPIVGASSFLTWRMDRNEALERGDRLERLADHGGALVQPFVEQIVSAGEWSLVYFDGRFSHAVRKRAVAGEFRVQIEFGGREISESPPAAIEAAARAVLRRLPETPLYARVDGFESAGGFVLTELELIEPVLFLGSSAGPPRRFARAVAARLAAAARYESR